jgi:hypothetical protein
MDNGQIQEIADQWFEVLGDMTPAGFAFGVHQVRKHEQFFPTPAQVREHYAGFARRPSAVPELPEAPPNSEIGRRVFELRRRGVPVLQAIQQAVRECREATV